MRFIFLGDPQCSRITGKENDYTGWQKLLRDSLKRLESERTAEYDEKPGSVKPPLVLVSGDLVNKPDDDAEWKAFFEACDEVRKDYDYIMVSPTGNHGHVGGYETIEGYKERFLLPGNGPFGHENGFFSFDYEDAHFIVLDSNYMDNTDTQAQKYLGAWIKHDLAVNQQPAVFALMHHPMYSTSDAFNDTEHAKAMRDGYLNLLYRYGVDLILCGHEHLFCRTADEVKVTQIMGVSGNKHFYAKNRNLFDVICENVVVTTFITVNQGKIKTETLDSHGNCIDCHEQAVRQKKPRDCSNCERLDTCGGTGAFELEEHRREAEAAGRSPLIPTTKNGIIVVETTFSNSSLKNMNCHEYVFSVMRRGKLKLERKYGFKLKDILPESVATLTVVNRDGFRFRYDYSEISKAKRFNADTSGRIIGEETVPPILFFNRLPANGEEDEEEALSCGIAVGQLRPDEYNGRLWMNDIVKIEVEYEVS